MANLQNRKAVFRFYQELNDFLPPEKKKKASYYFFFGNPSVKDAIEAVGVPHTEVDLIVVNTEPAGFDYNIKDNDHISVYPVFENLDISSINKLRPRPLREPKFVVDVHLGKLAKKLRMLGLDTYYENDLQDPQIVKISTEQKRIILTKDQKLLHNSATTRGYWIRSKHPVKQATEVVNRFDLYGSIEPFKRCMECNGLIEKVDKPEIEGKLDPKTKRYYHEFYQCSRRHKIYWKGSHFKSMKKQIERILTLDKL